MRVSSKNICYAKINGVIMTYDFASEKSLSKARKAYADCEYIGSGHIHSINGVRQSYYLDDTVEHFFVLKCQ